MQLHRIEEQIVSLGERSREELLSLPGDVREYLGTVPLFEAAAIGHAAVDIAVRHWPSSVPEDARYVFAGLATRALKTSREIAVLLEHGYADAARSRWRTMSEILVVARVLALGDRYTCTRYKEHRWVAFEKQRRNAGQTDWSGPGPSPEVMKRRLVRRFGPNYGRDLGWAARISAKRLGVERPQWSHLRTLAEVGEHESRINQAHHAVHGQDPLGLLGSVVDDTGAFHAGASLDGVLETGRDSIRLLRQVLLATFDVCLLYGHAPRAQVVASVIEVHLLSLEQDLSWRILLSDPQARARYDSYMATHTTLSNEPPPGL
ncbi:DUF5677 domain-containing protein [Clavibacter zhangzhiyongii]|uniref:DUF5677 domain-containing protein n=1 Tax=Clavibacter zhangzhiyongii TaxID=2768071 RepID=UPI0039E12BBE